MNRDSWGSFLETWAAAAIKKVGDEPGTGPLFGLGFAGASESMLADAERRLGSRLPPSYRAFLECTNGLQQPLPFVPARGGNFWSVEELDWFRTRNAEWIDAYTEHPYEVPDSLYFVYGDDQDCVHFRGEYLRECLELSHDGDSAVYLLNPRVIGADGEWEAWFFANWNPGAVRYRSFAELMRSHYLNFSTSKLDGF